MSNTIEALLVYKADGGSVLIKCAFTLQIIGNNNTYIFGECNEVGYYELVPSTENPLLFMVSEVLLFSFSHAICTVHMSQ